MRVRIFQQGAPIQPQLITNKKSKKGRRKWTHGQDQPWSSEIKKSTFYKYVTVTSAIYKYFTEPEILLFFKITRQSVFLSDVIIVDQL